LLLGFCAPQAVLRGLSSPASDDALREPPGFHRRVCIANAMRAAISNQTKEPRTSNC
jgi:hypothetical protein